MPSGSGSKAMELRENVDQYFVWDKIRPNKSYQYMPPRKDLAHIFVFIEPDCSYRVLSVLLLLRYRKKTGQEFDLMFLWTDLNGDTAKESDDMNFRLDCNLSFCHIHGKIWAHHNWPLLSSQSEANIKITLFFFCRKIQMRYIERSRRNLQTDLKPYCSKTSWFSLLRLLVTLWIQVA